MAGLSISSNKHIVWITPGFAKNMDDDTCIPTMQDLLRGFGMHKDIKVSIITLQYPFTSDPYSLYGAQVYPMNGKNKWVNKFSVWKKTMRKLKEIHIQQPITAIHSFWLGETALIGEAFTKGKNIPHICTLMGQDVLTDNRYLKNKRLTKVPKIAISTFQAEVYKRNTGLGVKAVIPFGMLDLETYALENKWEIEDDANKMYDVIGIGSLSYVKNYEMFIDIIEEVKKSYPQVNALIVGSGEEKKELEKLVEKKGLRKSISFSGQKTRAQVIQLLGQSKVFVHTAKHEGQGYVFIETMNKKLPIMSTPVGYACDNEKIWKGTDIGLFAEEIINALRNQPRQIKYNFPTAKEASLAYLKLYTHS